MIRLKSWDKLPSEFQNEQVKEYYDCLKKKRFSLVAKRLFDLIFALLLLVLLSPVFLVLAIWIKLDSKGPVFFRQVRITTYGKEFRIFKFRTMVQNAESLGTQVTVGNDMRITKVGSLIRKCRLDEIPQLLNVLSGDMSFVGTRPEVRKYVDAYSDEMLATLLMPAGITSTASIRYKDEDKLLECASDVDKTYIEEVLPGKMKYNLLYIKKFSFFQDIKICIETVIGVLK